MKTIICLKKNRGMTLVELIVSVFLLSLIGLMLVTVFSISSKVVGDNAMAKKNSENAAAGIENKMAYPYATPAPTTAADIFKVGSESGSFVVTFNGFDPIETLGSVVSSTDSNGENKYYYFIPD